MTKPEDLTAYLFEGLLPQRSEAAPLSADLLRWMEVSARFTAFVETYRDKIRKKIRVTRDLESLLDLRSEVEVAYCLLKDRHLSAAYEPYASEKRRGPDYAVTYRVNTVFHLEVARLRSEARALEGSNGARQEDRLLRVLINKLGQMQPASGNLLVVHTLAEWVQAINLMGLMNSVKMRVESKDSSFSEFSRYASPAAFYKDFQLLSGILLWSSAPDQPVNQLWVNKQARPGIEEKVLRAVSQVLS